jgi:hypothetical protein
VKLDDLTFIGTGSEWFWTMVSGLVVAVTFIIIYRQLKAQAAANAFQRIETVHRRWASSELVLARLEVALQLRDGTLDVADDTRADTVLSFFELVRDLNRQGYLDDEEIARSFGAAIVVWWRLLEPVIQAQSSLEDDPEMWIGLKELDAMVMRYDRKRGVDRTMVLFASTELLLASVIKRETHRLTLARDAASGFIPGGIDAPTVPPATTQAAAVVHPSDSSPAGRDIDAIRGHRTNQ